MTPGGAFSDVLTRSSSKRSPGMCRLSTRMPSLSLAVCHCWACAPSGNHPAACRTAQARHRRAIRPRSESIARLPMQGNPGFDANPAARSSGRQALQQGHACPSASGRAVGVRMKRLDGGWLAAVVVVVALAGCASTPAAVHDAGDYRQRAVTRADGGVRVSTAALTAQESERVYGEPLAKKSIQPVWIEVENHDD